MPCGCGSGNRKENSRRSESGGSPPVFPLLSVLSGHSPQVAIGAPRTRILRDEDLPLGSAGLWFQEDGAKPIIVWTRGRGDSCESMCQSRVMKSPAFWLNNQKKKKKGGGTGKYWRDHWGGRVRERDPVSCFWTCGLTYSFACMDLLQNSLPETTGTELPKSQTRWRGTYQTHPNSTAKAWEIELPLAMHLTESGLEITLWTSPGRDCLLRRKYQHSPWDFNKMQSLITQYSKCSG